ncbi:TPA: hypothetical protein ACKULV_001407, partial [Neisseria gonorrhoeae]
YNAGFFRTPFYFMLPVRFTRVSDGIRRCDSRQQSNSFLSPIRKSVLPVLVFLLEYCHYDRNHSVFSQTLSANPRFGEKVW